MARRQGDRILQAQGAPSLLESRRQSRHAMGDERVGRAYRQGSSPIFAHEQTVDQLDRRILGEDSGFPHAVVLLDVQKYDRLPEVPSLCISWRISFRPNIASTILDSGNKLG